MVGNVIHAYLLLKNEKSCSHRSPFYFKFEQYKYKYNTNPHWNEFIQRQWGFKEKDQFIASLISWSFIDHNNLNQKWCDEHLFSFEPFSNNLLFRFFASWYLCFFNNILIWSYTSINATMLTNLSKRIS